MEAILTDSIRGDLIEVEMEFEKSLQPWWDDLRAYLPAPGDDAGFDLLPALVINAYRWAGSGHRLTIQMANLFRTINLANLIHLKVRDTEEGQEHNQQLQFTILIGDYVYGRVLKLLLETGAESLLTQFAAMIASINEGLVMRYKLDYAMDEYLSRGRAPFYANAFSSAARLQGWDMDHVEAYEALGKDLGMGLEMIYAFQQQDKGFGYLRQAEARYKQLSRAGLVCGSGLDPMLLAIWGGKDVAAGGV